jgi:membrane associated rhomboid family serine protease
MARSSVTLSLPPFSRAIKWLVGINTAIFMLMIIARAIGYGSIAGGIMDYFALVAHDVAHGQVWELLTYGFVHAGLMHLFFNMLMLWMFGSMLEAHWGQRKFTEFFLFGIVGAGIGTVIIAYTIGRFVHLTPLVPTVGSSGGIYAIYIAVAMLFGDREVYMFPLPIAIRLKYLVGILGFLALAGAIGDAGGTANIAHLSGLLAGYLYIKFAPRAGLSFAITERFYGMQNDYHRWKRRRAGRKFEVYMRKHEKDPKQYFDEYGNFKPPDDKDKKDKGGSGWVN